ncbi:MAG: DUF488 family protein [Candidatus Bathyarchaeia archaeon]
MATVYTIGYGGRKFEDFVHLLKRHGVVVVVDVRRFPKSKYPGFDGKSLQEALPKLGIEYLYLGDLLGGFRRGGYQKYMESREYQEGIKRLLEVVEKGGAAIMCVERSPRACHRRFITSTLEGLGVKVVHIIKT